jgi:hypothetical protein
MRLKTSNKVITLSKCNIYSVLCLMPNVLWFLSYVLSKGLRYEFKFKIM